MTEKQKKECAEFFRDLKLFALACVLYLLGLIGLLIGFGGFIYGFGATFFASILKGVSFMIGGGLLAILGACLGVCGYFVWSMGNQEEEKDD